MSDNVIQTSFSAGELSPNLFARVDFAKYRSGCATMRNFFVDYRSGASTRPGTEFIRPGKIVGGKIRLVRFQQSTTVTYVLEFGDKYIRFVTQGSSVVEPAIPINNISNSIPVHVSAPTNNFAQGDMVFISGVAGMPQVNNRYFTVSNPVSGGLFTAVDALTNAILDSTHWGVYGGGGTVQRVYTITTPYAVADLPLLKFSQNASIMNITHPKYPPHKLQLFTATNWNLSPAVFGSTAAGPTFNAFTSSTTGAVSYKYAVTSVDANNQESTVGFVYVAPSLADLRTVAGTNQIVWNSTGAFAYNVYGSSPSYTGWNPDTGGLGFIGTVDGSEVTLFTDSNISPDFAQSPPIHENPFTNVNPSCSSYFQQRLVYANGGGGLVATFWASRTGAPYNFDVSNPVQANDAITASLVSLEVNEIMSLIPMPTGLIALTTNGAWQINGGAGGVATQGGPITPVTATATPQAYIGANNLPPIVINYDILFVQAKGSIVRDMTFNIYANIYTGNDVSILSSHMFYNHQILEWTYAEEPFKTIWAVREDGTLLCLTLVKEQDMYGWSRHDTKGNFESVTSVTEGQFDAVYVAVRRPNPRGGGFVVQIERMADRTFQFGAEDAWCVDAGSKSVATFPNAIIGIHPTDANGNALIGISADLFTPADVGKIIRSGGGILKVIEYLAPNSVKARVIRPIEDVIPNDPLNTPDYQQPGTWTMDKTFTKVFGLDHLEGQKVVALADGGVVGELTVVDGSVTMPQPVSKIVVGYPFQAQLQTMPLDLGNEINSVQGKRKKVGALTVRVKDSRGVKAGMTFQTVTPIKELNRATVMGLPISLYTADERIVMDPLWDVPGQICIQVDDPLPTTILGVIPEVVVGDSQK
jgi:hypothetical protein